MAGQRFLVTGAGGSVGSELARTIARCHPARLVLLDQSEYQLFKIIRELEEDHPTLTLEPVLADITRRSTLEQVCRAARPHVVYHAAAYKHVTMLEAAVVPAVVTNVLGTLHVTRAARAAGARLVFVSSDKAAKPGSVMGASKRLAELLVLNSVDTGFRPLVVRFGNVLGSSGSVAEVVLDRVRRGLPIRLTDPEATRFFMTPAEAVGLMIKADLIGCQGGIYWLDTGVPIRIGELAERIRTLAVRDGCAPVPIEVIGLRPGEKLREQLTPQGLELRRTADDHIWMARQPRVDRRRLTTSVRALRAAAAQRDDRAALQALCAAVPEYEPSAEARRAADAASAAGPFDVAIHAEARPA